MKRQEKCPFCNGDAYIAGEWCFARFDLFPVSPGHTLIVPKRHVSTWFEMSIEEQVDGIDLIRQVKTYLDQQFQPDGYNIGMNCGLYAGQTIGHAHIHVIPRYKGDVARPDGGVRGVIPDKKEYAGG